MMKRIIVAINLLIAILALATCERADMYNLATIGLAPKTAIYIYAIGPMSGGLGGRNSVDNMCYNQGTMFYTLINASIVKGFISMSMFDDLRLLVPGEYWSYPVIGITSLGAATVIASTWAGMMTGSTASGIDAAVGISSSSPNVWWSGSGADGSYDTTNNCNSWYTSETAYSGQVGAAYFNSTTATCDSSAYLLCIAY